MPGFVLVFPKIRNGIKYLLSTFYVTDTELTAFDYFYLMECLSSKGYYFTPTAPKKKLRKLAQGQKVSKKRQNYDSKQF